MLAGKDPKLAAEAQLVTREALIFTALLQQGNQDHDHLSGDYDECDVHALIKASVLPLAKLLKLQGKGALQAVFVPFWRFISELAHQSGTGASMGTE